ncbi:MAG: hypothetical protein ACK452_10115 [Bacteroidota bacterium]|jgi:hypothetical protein
MRIFFFIGFISICYLVNSQNNVVGARATALGGVSSTFSDVWSAHNNQAGLADLHQIEAGAYYENRFLVKELNYSAFVAAIPLKKNGGFGLSYTNFGFSVFRQTKVGLGYGMRFSENFSAGVQLDYFQARINDATNNYGNKGIFTGELGFLAKLTKQVSVSGHLYNIARAKIASYNNEIIPVVLKFGLHYKVSERVSLLTEAEKGSYTPMNIKGGVEYNPAKDFYLRAGANSNPMQMSFGAGVKYQELNFDLSSSWHSILGFSPQIGLSYRIGKPVREEKIKEIF